MSRTLDKVKEIEKYMGELSSIVPANFNKYSDLSIKAACERYVEKIVEAAVDLAFLIIKLNKLNIPEDDIDAFTILKKNKIITEKTSEKLKDAKRMRNIIVHQYGKIDDKIVYKAVTEELEDDTKTFIKEVKKWL